MEVIIALVVVVGLLVLLDIAALKWGVNSNQASWPNAGYDPRYNWNSQTGYPFMSEEESSDAPFVTLH